MTRLDRRLARLEAQMPQIPAVVRTARAWLADWDDVGPRAEAWVVHLRDQRAAGAVLSPLDLRILHLSDDAWPDASESGLSAQIYATILEIAA